MAVTRARSKPGAIKKIVETDNRNRPTLTSDVVAINPTPALPTDAAQPQSASTSKAAPTDGLPIYAFPNPTAFEAFIDREHHTCPGFHLKIAKKSSGIPSITAPEAVEVALCFGWIDGRANSLDDKYYLIRYTQRRAKSIWSQKNVNTVARLVKEGKMRPAGLAAVEAAKADGRWDRAYAGPANIVVSEDFENVLEGQPAAKAFFEGLNRSERYAVLWRVETASPTARQGRVDALVQMLAVGKVPGRKSEDGQKENMRSQVNLKEDMIVKSEKMATKTRSRISKQVARPSGKAQESKQKSGR